MAPTKPIAPKKPLNFTYKKVKKLSFDKENTSNALICLPFGIVALIVLITSKEPLFILYPPIFLGLFLGIGGLIFFYKAVSKKDVEIKVQKGKSQYSIELLNFEKEVKAYEASLQFYNQAYREYEEKIEETRRETARQQEAQKRKAKELLEKWAREEEAKKQEEENRKKLNAKLERIARLEGLEHSFKTNWREFQNLIETKNISKLYHFTDRDNLASIIKSGHLYSWDYCQTNGININKPGGNSLSRELDEKKGLQNYVRLSFNKDNPMLYRAKQEGRISNPVFLEIDPLVIFFRKTLFSKENATKTGVYACSSFETFFDIVSAKDNPSLKILETFGFGEEAILDKTKFINPKAEVLVYERIPLEYITNINSV